MPNKIPAMVSNTQPLAWVIIPAAGCGQRMQAARPKQYLTLQSKTVLEHTLDCFLEHPAILGIVVVVSDNDQYWPGIAAKLQQAQYDQHQPGDPDRHLASNPTPSRRCPIYQTTGGNERADSVLNGLLFLQTLDVDVETPVLVHDAARPCLMRADLNALLAMAEKGLSNGVILGTPVNDTMKRAVKKPENTAQLPDDSDNSKDSRGLNQIIQTEAREGLWHALTPQLAGLGILQDALQNALHNKIAVTDESSALEYAGLQPYLLEGKRSNIKITRPADLALAEFFLQQPRD